MKKTIKKIVKPREDFPHFGMGFARPTLISEKLMYFMTMDLHEATVSCETAAVAFAFIYAARMTDRGRLPHFELPTKVVELFQEHLSSVTTRRDQEKLEILLSTFKDVSEKEAEEMSKITAVGEVFTMNVKEMKREQMEVLLRRSLGPYRRAEIDAPSANFMKLLQILVKEIKGGASPLESETWMMNFEKPLRERGFIN